MAIKNRAYTMAEAKRGLEKFRAQCVEKTKEAARLLTRELMDRTPVWSGKTVRNYEWAFNSLAGTGMKDAIGGPGYVPGRGWAAQRLGDPGPTNSMPLPDGEPRRAANEAAAEADLESVLSNVRDLGDLNVTNNSDIWDLVDNGSAPTPERARNPGGTSRLAEQAVKSKMGGVFK